MMASVDGMISAAPMPMLARAAISMPTEPENAAQVDPAANAASPARNVRFRPIRSARLPATSSSPANTITYESTIHCSALEVACKSRTSVGRATFRTVLSSVTISSEMHSTASAIHRREAASPAPDCRRRDAAGARSHGSIPFRRGSASQGRKSPGWSWRPPSRPGRPGPGGKCPAAVVRAGSYREDEVEGADGGLYSAGQLGRGAGRQGGAADGGAAGRRHRRDGRAQLRRAPARRPCST